MDTVDADELRAIFLKKRFHWSVGDRAIPINAKNLTLRRQFQMRFLEMNPKAEYSYWEKEKITKGIVPPPEFTDTLRAVFKLKGSVSYIFRFQYKPGVVKIVHVVPTGH